MTSSDVEIPRAAYGLAFPLAVVAGYVDAVGFLTLAGLFVAHMSGNTVRLGVFVGDGDWSLAAQRLVPIIVFTIGVAGGIALVEALRRRSAFSTLCGRCRRCDHEFCARSPNFANSRQTRHFREKECSPEFT